MANNTIAENLHYYEYEKLKHHALEFLVKQDQNVSTFLVEELAAYAIIQAANRYSIYDSQERIKRYTLDLLKCYCKKYKPGIDAEHFVNSLQSSDKWHYVKYRLRYYPALIHRYVKGFAEGATRKELKQKIKKRQYAHLGGNCPTQRLSRLVKANENHKHIS